MSTSRYKWSSVFLLVLAAACSDSQSNTDASAGDTSDTGGARSGGTSNPASGGMQTTASGGAMGTGGSGGGGENGSGGSDAGTATGGDSGTGGISGCRAPEQNSASGNTCYGAPPADLTFTEITSGLTEPTFMTHAPGDSTRLFVLERSGLVRVIKDGQLLPTPFIDLSAKLTTAGQAGERGLLGLAFDPNYAKTKRFWVDYSGAESVGGTVIESYVANADGETADANSGQVLLEVPQPAENHNGGMLAFGPDDCLFIAMGDGGGSNDTYQNGQDPSTPLAGLLRVDVDNYSQTVGAPGNTLAYPHLWSYGLRNPWRFSFDRASGDLYIGDVGQGAWEEVDVEPRGVGGRNYGWPCREGLIAGPKTSGCDSATFTDPVAVQENGMTQNQSVIGGYVYRGQAIPSLVGRYIYADYNSREIWTFTWQGDGQICDEYTLTAQLTTGGSISSFGEDADGELYVLVYSTGRLLRIDPK